jgi:hypothetical protein
MLYMTVLPTPNNICLILQTFWNNPIITSITIWLVLGGVCYLQQTMP